MDINGNNSNCEKRFYSVGVGDLVFFTKRSGDLNIDSSTYGRQRMQEGIRLHSKIQKSKGDGYHSEVFLSQVFEFDDMRLEISGRADGINFETHPIYIEEIKSHSVDYKDIKECQKAIHWAQLFFYGYLFLSENNVCEEVELHLSYIQVDSEVIHTEKKQLNFKKLKIECDALINVFRFYLIEKHNRETKRNNLLLTQTFPLEKFRKGQRDLAATVYRQLKRKENLFLEAPTGMGKTIGCLFPALKLMGETVLNQIFFLTAKGTGKETAVKAMQLMNRENEKIRSLVITSKSKTCFKPDSACDPEECEFTHSYFDKINDALKEAHSRFNIKGKEEIEEIARKYEICPFEFSLDLIFSSDVIICDYNYAFDPRVHLKRIFSEENKNVVILADETHNLVSRARDMYSSEIDENKVLIAKQVWSKEAPALKKPYIKLMKSFLMLRKIYADSKSEFIKINEGPEDLIRSLRELMFSIERFNKAHPKFPKKKKLTEDYFYYLETVRIWELYGSGHTTLIRKSGKKISVKLLCLDASFGISGTTERVGGSVFFSATLTPIEFYVKSLFGNRKMYYKNFPSPFPKKNVLTLVADYISVKYKDRDNSLDELCETILTVVKGKRGNYMVFCPSFAYLTVIYKRIQEINNQDIQMIAQVPEMTIEEREVFLSKFNTTDNMLVGFVVSAGVFGEGIDLVGKKLIGAIVVGVGLPGINEETDAVSEYYEEKYKQGFEFAYQYPGINTVLQNSGRVIRSEFDKGIICFIDKRYSRRDYKQFISSHRDIQISRNINELKQGIKIFWEYK